MQEQKLSDQKTKVNLFVFWIHNYDVSSARLKI